MISLEDIEDMTSLTRAEIAAIAEHENLPLVSAATMGEYMMHHRKGPQAVQRMICEDIREALHVGDLDHARALFVTLREYISEHPEAQRGARR